MSRSSVQDKLIIVTQETLISQFLLKIYINKPKFKKNPQKVWATPNPTFWHHTGEIYKTIVTTLAIWNDNIDNWQTV